MYVDETTFNTWMTKQKIWQVKNRPIQLPQPRRVGRCTLYGAISDRIDPVYHVAESTNRTDFGIFLQAVVR